MVSSVIHLANKDYAALVDDFIDLKILPDDCNRAKARRRFHHRHRRRHQQQSDCVCRDQVIPLMDKALSPYVKGGGAKRYEAELKQMYGFDDKGTVGGFQAMTEDLLTVLNEIPFSIPPYFALLARAVVTLEGIALGANPDYGIVLEAYPFVARKLLDEDRPELQRALQQVLYGGGGEAITPTRLISLLNSASGNIARKEGATFVDIDAVADDGLNLSEALSLVLSENSSSSLRGFLETEALGASDLLLRQAARKAAPALVSLLPRPPTLPFLPALPDPMTVRGPFVLPGVSPALRSPQEVLDALAPKLTREEELYALAIADAAKSTLGADAAALISGDLATDPAAAARLAPPILEAIAAAAAPTDHAASPGGGADPPQPAADGASSSAAVASLARAAASAISALPLGTRAASDDQHSSQHAQLEEWGHAIAGLGPAERENLQAAASRLASGMRGRLEERLGALR